MSLRRSPRANACRGFSLVEVTVVMAIVGILAGVGIPTMHQWLERYRARTTAQEIASQIQLQRMRAVSQNQDFSIDFDASAGTYQLYEGLPATGTQLEAAVRTLPNGIVFARSGGGDAVDTPSDEITFHSDGTLNDSTATTDAIYISNALGDVFLVSFHRSTGRVQVQHQSYGY